MAPVPVVLTVTAAEGSGPAPCWALWRRREQAGVGALTYTGGRRRPRGAALDAATGRLYLARPLDFARRVGLARALTVRRARSAGARLLRVQVRVQDEARKRAPAFARATRCAGAPRDPEPGATLYTFRASRRRWPWPQQRCALPPAAPRPPVPALRLGKRAPGAQRPARPGSGEPLPLCCCSWKPLTGPPTPAPPC